MGSNALGKLECGRASSQIDILCEHADSLYRVSKEYYLVKVVASVDKVVQVLASRRSSENWRNYCTTAATVVEKVLWPPNKLLIV